MQDGPTLIFMRCVCSLPLGGTMTIYRVAFAAVVGFALGARSVEAGSVTYDFIQLDGNSKIVEAVLVFSSLPASATQGWSTSDSNDLLSFSVMQGFLGPVGVYSSTITSKVISDNGTAINSGAITGTLGTFTVTATFSASPYPSVLSATQRFGVADRAGRRQDHSRRVGGCELCCARFGPRAVLLGSGRCRRAGWTGVVVASARSTPRIGRSPNSHASGPRPSSFPRSAMALFQIVIAGSSCVLAPNRVISNEDCDETQGDRHRRS